MNNLEWLRSWYANQCDGAWEHGYGIAIGALDNPGWTFEVDLITTRLAHITFSAVRREGDEDWFVCRLDANVLKAAGGAKNLDDKIYVFRTWATDADTKEQA